MPTISEFKLPDIGEGLTEGEIVKWMVAVGDTVTLNQPIVEVETSKVTVELPSPYAGLVTVLHYPEGATVEVGAPIIAIDTDPDGTAPATPDASEGMLVGPGPKTASTARRARHGKPPGVAEAVRATKTAVHSAFDPPPSISGMPPAVPPTLDAPAHPDSHGAVSTDPPPIDAAVDQTAPTDINTASGASDVPARPRAKPPVRKYAKDSGVDLAACTPTGPGNVVTRADVDNYLAMSAAAASSPAAATIHAAPAAATPTGREERIPVKGIRKATAQAMVSSAFTAPHVTEWITIDVTPMMKLRKKLAADPTYSGVKLSPLVFVAKAVLMGLRKYPMVNSAWDEPAQEIVVKHYANLGIAAATPRGLLVPNIKDADRLSLRELADAIATLTATARDGGSTAADLSGGSFTITNVGVFGVDMGTPIINPGEAAILAFGTIREQPWVHKGKVKARQVTTLGLSFDHRIIDGELGSHFLADVAALLTDPRTAFII
ncbi:pyruvate dehydrogenase E2 component (dihydrolipoamide acetyltransferase) [Antricoccus suffuscus]|uniref:Dihydrolipoamide acetyltransferase component of pyruvate dehydrogenase complex n=1 Tax=Antricoccus suffuscus TaxID=1629062 RepID=A0A2T0ZB52_9ACTN|nr:dihydrolipoamide acetyltransferase family protein [Antricoccus suffuscus]PRZ33566.1 pyruvate dehydrogenase E2 component (dihydrolipoamide acetyltransferase) [Antricoccus suffuscus]